MHIAKADFIYGTYCALPLGFLLSKKQHTLNIASIRRIQRYTVEEIAPLLMLQNPSFLPLLGNKVGRMRKSVLRQNVA